MGDSTLVLSCALSDCSIFHEEPGVRRCFARMKPARRSRTGPAPESSNTQNRNDEIYSRAALERGSPLQGEEGTGPHPFVKPLVFSYSFVLGVCSSTPTRRLVAL